MHGDGPAVALIHGTGTDSTVFEGTAAGLAGSFRVIAFDRRGWGASPAGPEYRRTSIAEQAIEAAGTIRRFTDGPVAVAGLGFGAVVALELALAEPELVAAALMIEPPILGLLPVNEDVSRDVETVRRTIEGNGEAAAYELFLTGGLLTLGAGAERFSDAADRGAEAARSCLVELPAVPAWPLDPIRLAGLETEVTIVTCTSTPDLLRHAADSITGRIPGCRRVEASTGEPAETPAELLA